MAGSGEWLGSLVFRGVCALVVQHGRCCARRRRLAPAGVTIEVRTLHGIPLYDADIENGPGIPEAVTKLKDEIASADGLLLVTPEYNNSICGVFKNAIDWLSRPDADAARVFRGRPVALMGASPGRFGTHALAGGMAARDCARSGCARGSMSDCSCSRRGKCSTRPASSSDPHTRERMVKFVEGYSAFVAANAQSRRI